MKHSMFRLLTVSLSIIAIAIFAGSVFAQGNGNGGGKGGGGGNGGGGDDPPTDPPSVPFNYRVELVDFHAGNNGSNGTTEDIAMVDDGSGESLFVVGKSRLVNGQARGFVYDRRNDNFLDVPTLLGLDESTWIGSNCTAISSNGIVVGWVEDTAGNLHGCWFDVLATNPSLNMLEDSFPEIVDGNSNYPVDVNTSGEVLTSNGWVVNIGNGTSHQLPAEIATGGVTSESAINEHGTVIGARQGVGGAIRYNIHTNASDEIVGSDGSLIFYDLNNVGEFCGYADVAYRRNRTRVHAYRWGDGPDYDWLSDSQFPSYSDGSSGFITGESLNDSGDVGGHVEIGFFFFDAFLHYSETDSNGNEVGTTYKINDLVNAGPDADTDRAAYLNSAGKAFVLVTERNTLLTTPAPIMVGNAEIPEDPENPWAGSIDEKIFILIPEDLP